MKKLILLLALVSMSYAYVAVRIEPASSTHGDYVGNIELRTGKTIYDMARLSAMSRLSSLSVSVEDLSANSRMLVHIGRQFVSCVLIMVSVSQPPLVRVSAISKAVIRCLSPSRSLEEFTGDGSSLQSATKPQHTTIASSYRQELSECRYRSTNQS